LQVLAQGLQDGSGGFRARPEFLPLETIRCSLGAVSFATALGSASWEVWSS